MVAENYSEALTQSTVTEAILKQCRTFTGDSVLLRFGWSAAGICVRTLCLSRRRLFAALAALPAGAPPASGTSRIRFHGRREDLSSVHAKGSIGQSLRAGGSSSGRAARAANSRRRERHSVRTQMPAALQPKRKRTLSPVKSATL